MAWTRAELESKRLLWLLTLEIRGKVFRFSTEPTDVHNSDPQDGPITYQYRSGLAFLDYEDTIGLFDSETSNREVSVSVLFGPAGADGWRMISDPTRDIGSGIGELSLLIEGDDYQNRQLVVRGNIEEPTHGAPGEPVDFTITESDWHDTAKFPKNTQRVNLKTWPKVTDSSVPPHDYKHDDDARGQFYPMVFGAPGSHPPNEWTGGGTDPRLAASPGLVVSLDMTDEHNIGDVCKVLIAGHWVTGGSPTVKIYNEAAQGWTAPKAVINGTDSRGQPVAYVEIIATGTTGAGYIEPGTELWVAWTGCGGLANEMEDNPLTGAGEVIRALLDRSKLRIDTLRSRVVLNEIDNYLLDFWINEQRSPWETITEDILELVPISPQVTPDGLGFVYWNWKATAADAVANFNFDRDFGERQSPVEISPFSEVYNEITINYCEVGSSSNPVKSLTYTWEKEDATAGLIHNPYSYASFTRYGPRPGLTIDTAIVEQDATARAILDWLVRFHSQTHRTVTYQMGQAAQIREVGDVVTVTDSKINWDAAVCLITGILRRPGYTEVTVTTVSDWTRDGLVE